MRAQGLRGLDGASQVEGQDGAYPTPCTATTSPPLAFMCLKGSAQAPMETIERSSWRDNQKLQNGTSSLNVVTPAQNSGAISAGSMSSGTLTRASLRNVAYSAYPPS